MDTPRTPSLAIAIGPAAAIAVAGLLAPARGWLGPPNVALVLVVVIVATAASSGRRAAAATSVTAALAFNFFHTRPYYTLRVDDRVDVISVVLLLVVGLTVGQLTEWRRRTSDEARAMSADLAGWNHLVELAAAGDQDGLRGAATELLRRELGLRACRFERTADGSLPQLERNGTVDDTTLRWTADGFALPEGGVTVEVRRGRECLGRLVLEPEPGVGVSLGRRRLAVAVADLLATAQVTPARTG